MNTLKGEDALTLTQVRKTYGHPEHGVKAVKSATFNVADNEFFTLLGPSGCGKTTLLRMLAGFENPNSGEILLYGNSIEHLRPQDRSVNTVFQHYSLFPHMTVRENIMFGLQMLKRDKQQAVARTNHVLALAKLEEFADRKPSQMSGGQQQRVALARALAPEPKVLLLDEPLSALDLKLRQAMRMELKQLQEETGITFVFVTHDQEEALAMSDRIAVLADGVIQQIGSPMEIYSQPENLFVADFIGENNFFNVNVKSADASGVVVEGSGIEQLLVSPSKDGGFSKDLQLAIRPENLSFTATGKNTIFAKSAKIKTDIYLGNALSYVLELADGKNITVRDSQVMHLDRLPAVGDELAIYAESTSAMLIDRVAA